MKCSEIFYSLYFYQAAKHSSQPAAFGLFFRFPTIMKTAAAFAAIVSVAVFITTDEIQATPSVRGLRSTAENQPTHEDESSKGHHHRHMKNVVKKVTKIAIPVPVGVPQYIPVPINVPSSVIASSNTAVVSSSNNAVVGTSTAAAGAGAAGGSAFGLVTPAPTTPNGRPVATPAPTTPASTIPASTTPAPTNVANANTHNGQQPAIPVSGTQNGDLGTAGIPTFSNVGGSNNAIGGGALGGGMFGDRGARMSGRLNGNGVGDFGQQMSFGTQGGNTFGGFGGQNAMGTFGQGGNNGFGRSSNNEFVGASGGVGHFGFEGTSSGTSRRFIGNSAFEREFHRREHQRRRRF